MLYPQVSPHEASPKAISGRTSYLRVRLEFHRYPHVIPTFFNRYGFGPPCPFTDTSTCTWIGHPVSGLQHATFAGYDSVSLRLRCSSTLTSLHTITRWPVLQKVRGHFRSLRTVLFAIGHWVVFRLGGWAPLLQTGFHVSGPTLDPALCLMFSHTGVLPSML